MCTKSMLDISKIFSKTDENDAYGWYDEEQEEPVKRKNKGYNEIEEIIYELEEIKMKLIRYEMKTKKVK